MTRGTGAGAANRWVRTPAPAGGRSVEEPGRVPIACSLAASDSGAGAGREGAAGPAG